jgi:hypothetical protein
MKISSTKSKSMFDAELWFRQNLRGAPHLKTKTIKIVAGFTLLWNLFEDHLCNNHANVNTFENITRDLKSTPKLEKAVNKSMAFYRNRYVQGQEIKPIFYELYFRDNDREEHVKAVLKREIPGIGDKVLALLIIAYRIRNHIFHGLKSVDNWDEQAKNISEASRILSIIIEAKGGYIIKRKKYLTLDDLLPPKYIADK